MRRILVLSALVLHLVACGEIQSSIGDLRDPDSVLPEDLIYKSVGDCDDGSLYFVALQTAGVQLWTDPSAVLTAQLELFINRDRTFNVRYREFDFSNQTFDHSFHSNISIDWKRDLIRLEGLGEGRVVRNGRRIYLDLTFTHVFNSELLQGQSTRFRLFRSWEGVDTDRTDYCDY